MMLTDLPTEARADFAVSRVEAGEDPYLMLAAIVWPNVELFGGEPLELCHNGLHAMTPENTYVRPGGTRNCRECIRIRKYEWRRKTRQRERRKVPCAYCGAPATSAADKGTGGLAIPRCRACFMSHLKSRKRRAA